MQNGSDVFVKVITLLPFATLGGLPGRIGPPPMRCTERSPGRSQLASSKAGAGIPLFCPGFGVESRPFPPAGGRDVSSTESESIELRIQALEIEHRDLDEIVLRLSDQPGIDELLLKRLKKRKLQLKDQIARLRSALIPDLDA